MFNFVRTTMLAAVAAGALGGCVTQPYGGYGSYGGYGGYGNNGSYGTTQPAPAYPVANPQPVYAPAPNPQPVYSQGPSYPQPAYPDGYSQPTYPADNAGVPQAGVYYGYVEAIEALPAQPANASGAGAVVGGLLGGLLGHQVGGGRGNTVATIGGAVAGAVAGNEIEKRTNVGPSGYRVRVRTNDNGYLTVTQNTVSNLRNGSRVRVENGVAIAY